MITHKIKEDNAMYCKVCGKELPPDSDPKFIFTAHSAWCNFEKSSNTLEVKLIRPEITKAEWQDSEGKPTSKGLVGEPLKLVAETKDMEGGVTFWIYDDKGREVTSIGAEIKGNKAEAEWTYHWNGEKLDAKPKYTFEVTGNRCKKVESGDVEIGAKIILYLKTEMTYEVNGFDISLIKNEEETNAEKISFDKGKIEKEEIIPAKYTYRLIRKESKLEYDQGEVKTPSNIERVEYTKATSPILKLDIEKENYLIISNNEKGISR